MRTEAQKKASKAWEARNKDKRNAYYRAVRNTPEGKLRVRNSKLKTKYGITIVEYDAMFKEQQGLCAICGLPERRNNVWLSVDHSHETGKVRGLLCYNCNGYLGMLEKTEWVEKAQRYLNDRS